MYLWNNSLYEEQKSLVSIIDGWRIANNNKFATEEIFREEYLRFINTVLIQEFNMRVQNFVSSIKRDFSTEIKKVDDQYDNLKYKLDSAINAIQSLTSIVKDLLPKEKKWKK